VGVVSLNLDESKFRISVVWKSHIRAALRQFDFHRGVPRGSLRSDAQSPLSD
jgi:hypothetical protein